MAIRCTLSVLLLIILEASAPAVQSACANPAKPALLADAFVSRVVDGDTLQARLSGGPSERIRLIGVDAPEMYASDKLEREARASGRSQEEIQAMGRLAWLFARRTLDGKEIGLERDVEPRDRYGRLLAYAWTPDGTMFNMLALREGYAQTLTIPPNVKYAQIFVSCQREARQARRGLWGPEGGNR